MSVDAAFRARSLANTTACAYERVTVAAHLADRFGAMGYVMMV